MPLLKRSVKVINAIWPFRDFLYILQLEEYYTWRYLQDLQRFFFRRGIEQSGRLEFTVRAKLTLVVSIVTLLLIYVMILLNPSVWSLLLIALVTIMIPLWVALANLLLKPILWWQRRQVLAKAALMLRDRRLKVVGIAGSFGKTTTKLLIKQLTEHAMRVAVTPRTINTPLGIAQWVMSLPDSYDLLVLEMDTYERFDIALSCSLRAPDIAVITSIGDQHLARIGSRRNLASYILELFDFARPKALKIISELDAKALMELGIKLTSEIEVVGKDLLYFGKPISTNLAAPMALSNLRLALRVAESLSVPERFVVDSCLQLQLPERRQQLTTMHGFAVIDNSYNISPTTATASIGDAFDLAQREGKKLVVVTAGIPELGVENRDANIKLGEDLARVAEKVYILNSVYASDIYRMASTKATLLNGRMEKAWEEIRKGCSQSDHLILILPELTDLSYR